jgi:hypothetical protein
MEKSRKRVVVLIILTAFALRMLRLDFQPLWWDEGYSVYFASMSLPSMIEATSLDIHPPLYYALLRGWIALAGPSPLPLRLFSVLIGTLTIPLFYFFARMLLGETIAQVAVLLLACSPFHVYYSQEIRMYGLVTLLGLGSTAALLLVLRDKMALIPVYILLSALALYTQYYAAFILLAHAAIILANRRKDQAQVAVVALLVSLTFYLPWVMYSGERLFLYVQGKKAIEHYSPLPLHYFLARHLATFGMGHMPLRLAPLFWAGGAVLSALVAVGIWTLRKNPEALWSLSFYLFVPLLGGFAVNLFYPFHPVYFERILLISLPPFLLLLACGISSFKPYLSLNAALTLMLISLASFYFTPRYPQDDYRPLAKVVSTLSSPDDVVLCVYPWQIGYFLSYCPELCPRPVLVSSPKWGHEVISQLESFWREGRKVWFPAFQARGAILESQIEDYASSKAFVGMSKWFGTTRLLLFAPPKAFSFQPVKVRFGQEVELAGFALVDEKASPAPGTVRIALQWGKIPDVPLNLQLRLADSLGRTWAQQDFPLAFWNRYAFLIPAGTPPGRYELRLKVYERSSGTALDAFDGHPPEPEPEFSLGTLTLSPPSSAVAPEKLEVPNRLEEELGGEVRLLGYSLSSRSLSTGEALAISLFWQAREDLASNYVVFAQLQDNHRKVLAGTESPPLYPTSLWRKGLVVKDVHSLVIPATLKPGTYNLVVGIYNPADGSRLRTSRGDDQVLIARVKVNPRPHAFARPSPAFKAEATFGSLAELIGYDLEALAPSGERIGPEPGGTLRVRRGWTIHLTLYWHPIGTTDKFYSVFVHLVDEKGQDVAYGDSPPVNGQTPTTSWVPGEYIADPHFIPIPESLPPGLYRLQVGLYLPPYGPRLLLVGGGDSFLLPEANIILEGE